MVNLTRNQLIPVTWPAGLVFGHDLLRPVVEFFVIAASRGSNSVRFFGLLSYCVPTPGFFETAGYVVRLDGAFGALVRRADFRRQRAVHQRVLLAALVVVLVSPVPVFFRPCV